MLSTGVGCGRAVDGAGRWSVSSNRSASGHYADAEQRSESRVGQAPTDRRRNAMLVCNNVRANPQIRPSTRAFHGGHGKSTVLRRDCRNGIDMEILDWLIAGTSVFGLVVYCAGMTLLLGALAWANHLDDRQENRATDARACSAAARRNATQ
jgi:hypothetical protein